MNVRQSYSKLTSYKLILLIILVYKDDMLMSPMKFCMDYMKGSKLFLIYIHIYIWLGIFQQIIFHICQNYIHFGTSFNLHQTLFKSERIIYYSTNIQGVV